MELYLQSPTRALFNPPCSASLFTIHIAGAPCHHDSNHQEQVDCYTTVSIKNSTLVCTKEVLLHAMGRCCLPISICAILPQQAYTLTSISAYCNRLTLFNTHNLKGKRRAVRQQGSQTSYSNNQSRDLARLCNIVISSSSHACNC